MIAGFLSFFCNNGLDTGLRGFYDMASGYKKST